MSTRSESITFTTATTAINPTGGHVPTSPLFQKGRQTMIDTVWDMPSAASDEQIDYYLNWAAGIGLDGFVMSAMPLLDWGDGGSDHYGNPTVIHDGGNLRLGDAYAQRLRNIIDRATGVNLHVCIVACWASSYVRNGQLHANNAKALGRALGDHIGGRQVDWWLGGDYGEDQPNNNVEIWRNMAQGLDNSGHINAKSYHGPWDVQYQFETWWDYNGASTGHSQYGDYDKLRGFHEQWIPKVSPKPYMASEAGYLRINVHRMGWPDTRNQSITPQMFVDEASAAVDAGCDLIVLGHAYRWPWGVDLTDWADTTLEGWDAVLESMTNPVDVAAYRDVITLVRDLPPPPSPPLPPGEGVPIRLDVGGDVGTEEFEVRVDGISVYTGTATSMQHTFRIPENTANVVVYFLNDTGPGEQPDRNLKVFSLKYDDVVIPTTNEEVYADGVWNGTECSDGYGIGPTLHCPDAYFDFSQAITSLIGDPDPDPDPDPEPDPVPNENAVLAILLSTSLAPIGREHEGGPIAAPVGWDWPEHAKQSSGWGRMREHPFNRFEWRGAVFRQRGRTVSNLATVEIANPEYWHFVPGQGWVESVKAITPQGAYLGGGGTENPFTNGRGVIPWTKSADGWRAPFPTDSDIVAMHFWAGWREPFLDGQTAEIAACQLRLVGPDAPLVGGVATDYYSGTENNTRAPGAGIQRYQSLKPGEWTNCIWLTLPGSVPAQSEEDFIAWIAVHGLPDFGWIDSVPDPDPDPPPPDPDLEARVAELEDGFDRLYANDLVIENRVGALEARVSRVIGQVARIEDHLDSWGD